ncbi:hypothetical protein CLOM_g2205 [Closterium sp. NIES-68]|nr:hypothetical protein CLOM_g2205 [Closterium sp. NIES-68]
MANSVHSRSLLGAIRISLHSLLSPSLLLILLLLVPSQQRSSSSSTTGGICTDTISGIRAAIAAKKYVARKEDVPLIKCGVCALLAKNLLRQVREKRAEVAPKKLPELKIIELVESACDVSKDEGDWIQWLDIQERGDKLELKEFPYPGDCRTECKTIQKSCQEVVGFSDTDVAELLYSQPSIQEADFVKELCHEITPTCRKKPPPLPKGRKPGEAFSRKSSTEVERERMMRDMDLKSEKYREENPHAPRMPKMKLYSRDDLLKKTTMGGVGMGGDDEEEEDEEGEEEDPEEKLRNELGPGTHVDMEAIRAALKAADEKEKQQEAALNSPLRRIYLSSQAFFQRASESGATLVKRFQGTTVGKHTNKLIRQVQRSSAAKEAKRLLIRARKSDVGKRVVSMVGHVNEVVGKVGVNAMHMVDGLLSKLVPPNRNSIKDGHGEEL